MASAAYNSNKITIVTQPQTQTADNATATFTVTATVSDGSSLAYQWEKQEANSSEWIAISGAANNILSLSNLTYAADNGDKYRVIVSAGTHSKTSDVATLTVLNETLWTWGANAALLSGGGMENHLVPEWADVWFIDASDTTVDTTVPLQVGSELWQAASAGGLFKGDNVNNGTYVIAIRKDETLWGWGGNTWGVLGDGTNINRYSPVQIGSAKWNSISTRGYHTIAIQSNSTLWGWGVNTFGELGDGTTTDRSSPVPIGPRDLPGDFPPIWRWKSVFAGDHHTIAIRADDTLWAWGLNSSGELGDGTTTNRLSLVQIGTSNRWETASVGYGHTLAIDLAGRLWAWGSNRNAQIGDGTTMNRLSPIQIGTSYWKKVSAGSDVSFAIAEDDTLWAWGDSYSLGFGYNADPLDPDWLGSYVARPKQLGSEKWKSISTSGGSGANWFTVAIRSDGTLWGWGDNVYNQIAIGNDDLNFIEFPTQIGSGKWISAEAGLCHSVGIRA